jgi:hypothetical protein
MQNALLTTGKYSFTPSSDSSSPIIWSRRLFVSASVLLASVFVAVDVLRPVYDQDDYELYVMIALPVFGVTIMIIGWRSVYQVRAASFYASYCHRLLLCLE